MVEETYLSDSANGKISGHLTWPLLSVTILTSFGSSMSYGYNLAVVNSPAEYIKDFYNETILERFNQSLTTHRLLLLYSATVSVFAVGGMVGSLPVGLLVAKFGQKGTLVYSTFLMLLATLLMGFSKLLRSPEMVILGRFMSGIHSGISLTVVPMYLGEIAPKNLRGFLGLIPSIFICLGVFAAQVLGLRELMGKEKDWPLLMSLFVIPTLVELLFLPWFPESPRYLLIQKQDVAATVRALTWYRNRHSSNIQAEIEEMQEEQRSLASLETISVFQLIADRSVRWQLTTVIVISMAMQLSGIDAVWFYTNRIFENAGIPEAYIQYTTVGTGAIEVVAGLIGSLAIERVGRRPLLIGGFSLMGFSCAGITISLLLQVPGMHYASVACVVGIIAGFCVGPAGVPFLMTAELFTQSHRPAAYIVGGVLNWLSNFTVGFVFPFLQMSAGAYCYLVFCGICWTVAIYAYIVIPETKNRTFMEISQMFSFKDAARHHVSHDELQLKKFKGYGTLENSATHFESSRFF
ncbi:solute carrier family 2, facilitated glucose transporter member 5-like isoform X2 [Scyliorhinus canicula]|uniref:solute carrier family 2, facilitated glucose transporter member 5-like isoform X2 n=1 Tax=Scyliorhinus canicula TaxID=7830 RepID=UPI0018F514CC|nr:solute carrier family 2, facilitated glucose transporter member 5-like isoform X2 [Scyliorhinus canicula]